jgi:3-oxoacyl-[acyl-carrier-protein] synthase III
MRPNGRVRGPARILGVGAALPERFVVEVDHPRGEGDVLFTGEALRHAIGSEDSPIETLTVEAVNASLLRADVSKDYIDRIYGSVSVSEFYFPNSIFAVHREAHLSKECLVIPLNGEHANLVLGVTLCREAMDAQKSDFALVVAGNHFTPHVDRTSDFGRYVSDGAASLVIGRGDKGPVIVDTESEVLSNEYGAMIMAMDGEGRLTFQLTPEGRQVYLRTGHDGPVRLVNRLLAKHGLKSSEITLISHQSSQAILDYWNDKIKPHSHLHTFSEHGNLVQASIGVVLDRYWQTWETRYLVLVGLGVGAQNIAVLLKNESVD